MHLISLPVSHLIHIAANSWCMLYVVKKNISQDSQEIFTPGKLFLGSIRDEQMQTQVYTFIAYLLINMIQGQKTCLTEHEMLF